MAQRAVTMTVTMCTLLIFWVIFMAKVILHLGNAYHF